MPTVRTKKCGNVKVSSKVKVGKPGSPRQKAYCARTAKIKGNWKSDPCSKNKIQRKRWKCK